MMGGERSKDEIGAQNMMKKHQGLERDVEDYADVVRQLGERSRNLMEINHPDRSVAFVSTHISVEDGMHLRTNTVAC